MARYCEVGDCPGITPPSGKDSGTTEPDSGTAEPDAGTPEPDAGTPEPDAGTPEPDAGVPRPTLPDGGAALVVLKVVLGYSHSCALTEGGVLWCWGLNNSGQVRTPINTQNEMSPVNLGSGWTDVFAASERMCALRSNGELICQGASSSIPLFPSDAGALRSMAMGIDFSCALFEDEGLRCWGNANDGQLGGYTIGGTGSAQSPDGGWIAVAAGLRHACAINQSRRTYCWGDNASRQVTDVPTVNVYLPILRPEEGFAGVSLGWSHSCGRFSDGGVRCWGANVAGQLGRITAGGVDGTSDPANAGPFSKLAAAGDTNCALPLSPGPDAGAPWCWGANQSGQAGRPASGANGVSPGPVPNLPGTWSSVVTGGYHSCAISSVGALWCWGSNNTGQLGLGHVNPVVGPQQVPLPP